MKSKKVHRITESLRLPATPYILSFLALGGYLLSLFLRGRITSVGGYYRIHYLYTYDHGYVARGLVGEVISWFFDTVSDALTRNVILLFSVLLMLSAVLCIGRAVNKVRDDRERLEWTLFLIVILCILPFSFRAYYTDVKLDKILWMLTLFSVVLAENKIGIWFVPILCALATMVNPVFLFCSMPLIAIILLQKFCDSGCAVRNGIICLLAYVSMIALALYGTIMEKHLGFATPQELVEYYFARDRSGLPSNSDYEAFVTEWLFDYFEPLNKVFKMAFDIYFKEWHNGYTVILNTALLAVPAYILLTVFWKNAIHAEENKFQKFIFLLCAVSPVVLIPPILISWESSKYFGNNILVQLCLIVYFITQNNAPVLAALEKFKQWGRKHLLAGSALIAYFAMCM